MARHGLHCSVLAFLGICLAPPNAVAQEPSLAVELNDAAHVNEGCRLSYVAFNSTGILLDKASFDVFIFGQDGRVGQSLVFPFGRLTSGRTKVVQFDLANETCAGISRLLINDIRECVAGGQDSTICIDALKTTTRTSIAFGL